MATDYGRGLNVTTGWPLRFTFASGLLNLGNNLCRRLQTPRGSLPWDLDCGWDVRQLLRGDLTDVLVQAAQASIGAECEKDPRVQSTTATLTFIAEAHTLIIALTITTVDGETFTLVLTADALTVAILRGP